MMIFGCKQGTDIVAPILDPHLMLQELSSWPIEAYQAGATVLAGGTTTGRLLVLIEGVVEVVRDGRRIAELAEPGAVFGELALLLDQPHTADVRTLAPSTFYVADGRTMLRVDPTTTLYVAAFGSSKVGVLAMASAAEPAAAMATATSPARRAKLCCTAWNLAMGRSKATRSLA